MKRILATFIYATLFAFTSGMALAQDLVGKAVVDGKTVTLYSDQTWRFDTPSGPAECKQVTLKLSFCGAENRWIPNPSPAPIIAAVYALSGTLYGQFIVEDVGTAAGLNNEFMRKAILDGVKGQTGGEPVILEVGTATFQGAEVETLVYQVTLNGIKLVFSNSVFLSPNTAAQIMTYEFSETYTETHKAAHAEFLEATRIIE